MICVLNSPAISNHIYAKVAKYSKLRSTKSEMHQADILLFLPPTDFKTNAGHVSLVKPYTVSSVDSISILHALTGQRAFKDVYIMGRSYKNIPSSMA